MRYYFLILLFIGAPALGQVKVSNLSYFKNFFKSDSSKQLLIIGESHASAAGSELYFPVFKYLNQKTGLHHLLIEFGPSEAYFYNKYLETGKESNLAYTIYGGFYKGWREAWRAIYEYSKICKEPIRVSGIDFDRTRTMGYALYSIFKQYDTRPAFIEDLMNEIKSKSFFQTYTIGYPTEKDIQWADSTKKVLGDQWALLEEWLNKKDLNVVSQIVNNKAVDYDKGREKGIAENVEHAINNAGEKKFMLMIGRDHAYKHHPVLSDKKWLAKVLSENTNISILTGVMLFENSELSVTKGKNVRLFEIRDKLPWKKYYEALSAKVELPLTIIPLKKDLSPLSYYTDFVLLAEDQKPYEVINAK